MESRDWLTLSRRGVVEAPPHSSAPTAGGRSALSVREVFEKNLKSLTGPWLKERLERGGGFQLPLGDETVILSVEAEGEGGGGG